MAFFILRQKNELETFFRITFKDLRMLWLTQNAFLLLHN